MGRGDGDRPGRTQQCEARAARSTQAALASEQFGGGRADVGGCCLRGVSRVRVRLPAAMPLRVTVNGMIVVSRSVGVTVVRYGERQSAPFVPRPTQQHTGRRKALQRDRERQQ